MLGECSMGPGIGFDCNATAPDCAMGNIGGAGHVSAGLPLSRFPERGKTTSTELIVNVTVGADTSCYSSCTTKIPATITRL